MQWLRLHYPVLGVHIATFCTFLPISCIVYIEPITGQLYLRWDEALPITGVTDITASVDYRSELFKTTLTTICFGVWTFETIVSLMIVRYHLVTPHHPKFYVTRANRISIISHIVGGTSAISGFYIGAIFNWKLPCFFAAVSGITLHLSTTVWQTRHLHGQREISIPGYIAFVYLLGQAYIDLFLYDFNFNTVFSAAILLNVYGLVRFWYALSRKVDVECTYDRTLLFAAFTNLVFVLGIFSAVALLCSIYIWNFWFNIFEPFPRYLLKIERGYNDSVPDVLEQKHGINFQDELDLQSKFWPDDKKKAITKALYGMISGEDSKLLLEDVITLFESWGMPDAISAAKTYFRKADTDNSNAIEYNEFEKAFQDLVDNIYIKGEYEALHIKRERSQVKEPANENLDFVLDVLSQKHGINFQDELDRQLKIWPEDKKKAITKALYWLISGEDSVLLLEDVITLFESWGMSDAITAAKKYFIKADTDNSNAIEYNEFESFFEGLIENIYKRGHALEKEHVLEIDRYPS